MRIPTFRITDQRNIKLAECQSVPRVMIITGPNGCGKSTLLQALRATATGGRPLYIGPHRASKRQRVRFRFLGPEIDMRTVLAGDNLPGYEGIELGSRARTPWDHDDAASFLKYGLCQIELDRREAIAERYDLESEIQKDSLPDVWMPLREMARNLLPHLEFEKIDTGNRDQIQCLWKVHKHSTSIDIDDLSSGEKSIIQLFYPLIEHRVRQLLTKLKGDDNISKGEPICALIDEPELHLHPNLQEKVLDYLRSLAVRDSFQFVIATHSPTIVESANSDELYLLRPAEMVPDGVNQLAQIATDEEKLRVLRDVFGSTSNLTAMRPVIVVEGKKEDRQTRRAVDSRIYAFLGDEFSRVTILPSGGKSECRALARSLNEILREFSKDLKAYALLDRDLEEKDSDEEHIHLLPVSMVENLVVDPQVIWQATVSVHHKMQLNDDAQVESAINEVLNEITTDEVSRRIKAEFGSRVFRLNDPVESADVQVTTFTSTLQNELSNDKINEIKSRCEQKVNDIKIQNKRREYFNGKHILEEFFKRHMHNTGMSKEIFVYECARRASERSSVKVFVKDLMISLGLESGKIPQTDNT